MNVLRIIAVVVTIANTNNFKISLCAINYYLQTQNSIGAKHEITIKSLTFIAIQYAVFYFQGLAKIQIILRSRNEQSFFCLKTQNSLGAKHEITIQA